MSSTCLAALLAALVSLPAAAETPQAEEASPKGQVVFYRTPGWVGSAVSHVVMVNGKRAAKLRSKHYTTLSLTPGEYTLCIFGDHLCLDTFEVKAGETYYIRDTSDHAYAGSGTHEFSIYLHHVDAAEGQQQAAGLKWVEPEADFK